MAVLSFGARMATIIVALGLAAGVSGQATDHQPHDVVLGLALSPDYSVDGTVFTTLSAPNNSAPLRSNDFGWTWTRVVRGMDNRHELEAFAISPDFTNDGTVFLASDGDGVYRTTDHGVTWAKVNNGLPTTRIQRIACDFNRHGNLVLIAAGTEGGMFWSDDRGESWTRVGPDSIRITALEFSPNYSVDRFVAAADLSGQLYRSVDGGRSFQPHIQLSGAGGVFAIEISPNYRDDGAIFVGTGSAGVWRSRNFGRSFAPVNNGITDFQITDIEISPEFGSDFTVFVSAWNRAVFKSTNGGSSWSLQDKGIRFNDQKPTSGHYYSLAISDDFAVDRTVYVAGFDGVFKSENAGGWWVEVEARPAASVTGFDLSDEYPGDPKFFISRYGGGLYRSVDAGQTWSVQNIGLRNPFVYSVSASPTFSVDGSVFAIQEAALALSVDEGQSWEMRPIDTRERVFPTVLEISETFSTDGTVFIGTRRDGIYRSDDGAQSFERVLPLSWYATSVEMSPDYATDQTVFAAIVGEGIIKSVDRGENWESINTGLGSLDRIILTISPNFSNDDTIYASSRDGLFRSTDRGETWTLIDTHPQIAGANISTLSLSPDYPTDGVMVVAVRGVGVFKSEDFGGSWVEIGRELIENEHEIKLIRFSPEYATSDEFFVLSDSIVFRTTDDGASFAAFDMGDVRYEDDHQQFYYFGSWRNYRQIGLSGNELKYTFAARDAAVFVFNGTGIRLISAKARNMGIVKIYLDNEYQADVDLYAPDQELLVNIFEARDLDPGPHFLAIIVTNLRNPDATDNGAVIDAVDVFR